jgi:psiF repeat
MIRIIAILIIAVVAVIAAPETGHAQTGGPAAAASSGKRVVNPQKLAACKRQATAQKLDVDGRRAFVRQCLRR